MSETSEGSLFEEHKANSQKQALLDEWINPNIEGAGNKQTSEIWQRYRQMRLPLKAVTESMDNHYSAWKALKEREFTVIGVQGLPELTARYRTSVRNSESIATLELCLRQGDTVSPVFDVRLLEATVNDEPTVAITALQRYTNEELRTVNKPFESKKSSAILSLKDADTQRYQEYTKETQQIDKLEKALGLDLSTIGVIVAAAFAQARGARQLLLIPYAKQFEIAQHLKAQDEFAIENNYDTTAEKLGFKDNATEFKGWHGLKANDGVRTVTIPEEKIKQLGEIAQGIGQVTLNNFTQALNNV
jgi:hypothetical protein